MYSEYIEYSRSTEAVWWWFDIHANTSWYRNHGIFMNIYIRTSLVAFPKYMPLLDICFINWNRTYRTDMADGTRKYFDFVTIVLTLQSFDYKGKQWQNPSPNISHRLLNLPYIQDVFNSYQQSTVLNPLLH